MDDIPAIPLSVAMPPAMVTHPRLGKLTAADVRNFLAAIVERSGSQKQTALEAGCSPAFLSDVLRGRREPSGPILDALGLERVVYYRAKSRNAIGKES